MSSFQIEIIFYASRNVDSGIGKCTYNCFRFNHAFDRTLVCQEVREAVDGHCPVQTADPAVNRI